MADPAAAAAPMTIDFLRARLLSERSVSRASKERADQLAARVAELEEQVRAVTAQRRQAEREAAEVLAVLESQGYCGSLSDVLDSGSDDADEEERGEPRDDTVTGGDPAPGSHGDGQEHEQEQPPAKGEGEEEEDAMPGTAPGGLSWKGRCASPRRARQLKQRHRRSYVYFLASQLDPSPKYRMGQSCRKNKRKELSSIALLNESRKEQRDGSRCTDDDGRTKSDGEVGGDDRRSSGDDGGQYVIRRDNDGEMERVLEKQAELIGQYEAQEKAQTDWEKQFNDTRSSPNKGDAEAKCQAQARTPKNASEEMARTAAVSAQGSSTTYSTATRRSQDQQGDANSDGCSSHYTNSASSGLKAPSESSPSVSKVSDWSSSRFHDHADDQNDTRSPCQQSGSTNEIDVDSVLQALQRARISLRQKLDRPLPPSQVTLALPAPGDEYRGDLYDDDGSSSYRDGHSGSSPSRQEILALGAPEDYIHGYHDHGSENCSTDGADTALTEKPSGSSPPQQEILALPAPGDDRDREVDVKIPASSPGLFRLPTDSFPKDEALSSGINGHDTELGLIEVEAAGHDTYRDDGAGVSVSAKQLYDPPTSGRCNVVPPGSGFVSGIPGLPEDLRKGRRGPDADLFMQHRGCGYTVSNKWML